MKIQTISSAIALLAMCTWGMAQKQPNSPKQVVYGVGTLNSARANSSTLEKKEYRLKKNSGKIQIDANSLMVEGYDGNEVIISTWAEPTEQDERAAGLQGFNSSGLKDNTGVGIQLSESEGTTQLCVVNPQKLDSVHIRLPNRIALSVKVNPSGWMSGTILLKDLSSEIEVSNNMGNINLQNVNGPMTVKTVHGNIEAILNKPVKGPVSLASTLGFIDVAVPISTPANLELRTTLGEIFAAEELNISLKPVTRKESNITMIASYVDKDEINKQVKESMKLSEWNDSTENVVRKAVETAHQVVETTLSSMPEAFSISGSTNRIQGTINGGGENINLRTTHGKIYLRTTAGK